MLMFSLWKYCCCFPFWKASILQTNHRYVHVVDVLIFYSARSATLGIHRFSVVLHVSYCAVLLHCAVLLLLQCYCFPFPFNWHLVRMCWFHYTVYSIMKNLYCFLLLVFSLYSNPSFFDGIVRQFCWKCNDCRHWATVVMDGISFPVVG